MFLEIILSQYKTPMLADDWLPHSVLKLEEVHFLVNGADCRNKPAESISRDAEMKNVK